MTSVLEVIDNVELEVEFKDGRIGVCISEKDAITKKPVAKQNNKSDAKGGVPKQGSLF